jgi:hypothetical protein
MWRDFMSDAMAMEKRRWYGSDVANCYIGTAKACFHNLLACRMREDICGDASATNNG